MTTFYILFLVPLFLFLVAFLYETWLSFARLSNPKRGRAGYVGSTWEITGALLIFSALVLLMTFGQDLIDLADALFWSTFIAFIALGLRAVLYLYIFYGRTNLHKMNIMDWLFALLHLAAAVFLLITAIHAVQYIWQQNPTPNTQFFPILIPGLVLVLALCLIPASSLFHKKRP